ncbi:trihelix transcription factor ASIL1-like isoform X1 [Zingiber officinale]|uniref:trihelix transcription factor ASIL1-like isoform X1 n=1 Tax=Zingiber officinale TaxID=94328 RepID=UPI001C4C78B9|nr:trihelix transcription factor ASIL1-like isoform X1 [Zingiber officinale]
MDDSDDAAGYPPDSRPLNPRLHLSSSSNRLKPPFGDSTPAPQFGRRYAEPDDNDDEEEQQQQNYPDRPSDDEDDDAGGGYRRARDSSGEDDDSSSDSRGKRRRIDKLALGFEFAPRVPPPSAAPPAKPPTRTLPPEWSEDSTFVLLDAWGDRYVQNGRKSLRADQWSEVGKKVLQASKVHRTDAQCRNRIDTLKKKYKKEKTILTARGKSGSKWVYFKNMDALMSPSSPIPTTGKQPLQLPPPPPPPPPKLPYGVDAGEYVFASSSAYRDRCNGNGKMRDSPDDSGSEDYSDGFPPKVRDNISWSSDSSFRMLADSIKKFGEIYEKMENYKRQQMTELERMRKEFQRDLELQKRQILERAQAEIAKLNEEPGEEDDGEDREDGDDDDDGSPENLSGFISASLFITAFV